MIAVDTETTGVDLHHTARPFFVTICYEDGSQEFWEWEVNPLTRIPTVPSEDLDAIQERLQASDLLILQNTKFDVASLSSVWGEFGAKWRWEATHNTLLMSHLLCSNRPHNLTDLATQYLGIDILPYEERMAEAVKKVRSMVQQARLRRKRKQETLEEEPLAAWRIAEVGLADMPSVKTSGKGEKDRIWKNDTWMLRAMARYQWETSAAGQAVAEGRDGSRLPGWEWHPFEVSPDNVHPWWTLVREYANVDSAVTLALYKTMVKEIDRRGLRRIYEERRKVDRIAYTVESNGVTINRKRLAELTEEYKRVSGEHEQECVNIACTYDYQLSLPKGGRNKSLDAFVFDVMKLEKVYNDKSAGSGPTLDSKNAIPYYQLTLMKGSRELDFINSLAGKRKKDTALTYMESYRRFWVHVKGDWFCLYPSLNPTGTDTLRWSSSNPNEQNIGKKEDESGRTLRYNFGPTDRREWFWLDARGIEDRLPAYESKQQELIDIFERADEPPYYGSNHLLRFHTVYPEIWEGELGKVCKDPKCCDGKVVDLSRVGPHVKKKFAASNYQWCKNGGFAVQYGAVDRDDGMGTADKAFHKRGAHALLKTRFSRLEALNQHCIDYANKHGYVETIPDRSVDPSRGYPIMCSRSQWGKVKPTVPLNYHIQSSAMWWMMKAMIRVTEFFDRLNRGEEFAGRFWPGRYFITLQVHDELVLDMPSGAPYVGRRMFVGGRAVTITKPHEYNLPIVREVKRLMEMGGEDFGIPTPVSCEYGDTSWEEGITIPL